LIAPAAALLYSILAVARLLRKEERENDIVVASVHLIILYQASENNKTSKESVGWSVAAAALNIYNLHAPAIQGAATAV
jgi:hypothetical protein